MRSAVLLAALGAAAIVAAPAVASSGRIAVGLVDGASADAVSALVEQVTGRPVDQSLEPIDAVVAPVDDVDDVDAALPALRALPGVEYVEQVTRSRSIAFQPNDPLAEVQWYLGAIHAFDFWEAPPAFPGPVLVAVIDSGIDADHPEFQGQIAAAASFVGGKATVDSMGHGTMVAGEIAAAVDNSEGIAGVGLPVKLLVGKVINRAEDGISVEAEAKAIRWAVDHGARVVNLSLGGDRAPSDPTRDTYSKLEQDAVNYAYSNGAVVVAATGNCEPPRACPYKYASYPAALPHVIGASAIGADRGVPGFSNRDTVFNDVAAPGVGIVSTFPTALTDPACPQPGYSLCAPDDYRNGAGTSFAAPLVSAAAAVLIANRQDLSPAQVMTLLERSAVDIPPGGRDSASGNGVLDILDALSALGALPLPPDDFEETNDDAGQVSAILTGTAPKVDATIDFYDDPSDVYRVYLRAGQTLSVRLSGLKGTPTLVLWRPGTTHVTEVTKVALRAGSIAAWRRGPAPMLRHSVAVSGWYYVQVQAPKRGGGTYELRITKTKTR